MVRLKVRTLPLGHPAGKNPVMGVVSTPGSLPCLSVLKLHYQARIVAFPVGLPPQNYDHLRLT
jgi:hypothetical protein